MSALENGLTGGFSLVLCILNIVALSIIVIESQNNSNTDSSALTMAEVGIGITLAVTGLYGIWHAYKAYYPIDGRVLEHTLTAIVMIILCILNIIAMAIILIETQGNSTKHVDNIALQMAEAGVGITLATTFIYGVYCLAKIGNSGHYPSPKGLSAADTELLLRKGLDPRYYIKNSSGNLVSV